MQAQRIAPICRFDTSCSRLDCYFVHPNGRMIDGSSPVVMCIPGQHDGMAAMNIPHAIPLTGVYAGNCDLQKSCRFGWECRRPDCYFSHPTGRSIDGNLAGPRRVDANVVNHSVNGLVRSFSALSTSSATSCGGASSDAAAGEAEQELMDTWFPKARHCTCCRGFIHGCAGDICIALGKCTCSVEESDMELPPGSKEPSQNGSAAANP
jgi:hypothetical protein